MSVSSIISQDITQNINLSGDGGSVGGTIATSTNNNNRFGSSHSQREQLILEAYENDPWTTKDYDNNNNNNKTGILKVNRNLLFQILMIENISQSKQSQLDEIKTRLDPKNQKVDKLRASNIHTDKRIITQVNMDSDTASSDSNHIPSFSSYNNSKSVYKLTIQNKNGDIYFAINQTPINWNSCMLGSKIIIKPNTVFNRSGTFIFQDSQVMFVGGINRTWNENRDSKMQDYFETKLNRDKALASSSSTSTQRKRKASLMQ